RAQLVSRGDPARQSVRPCSLLRSLHLRKCRSPPPVRAHGELAADEKTSPPPPITAHGGPARCHTDGSYRPGNVVAGTPLGRTLPNGEQEERARRLFAVTIGRVR